MRFFFNILGNNNVVLTLLTWYLLSSHFTKILSLIAKIKVYRIPPIKNKLQKIITISKTTWKCKKENANRIPLASKKLKNNK
ncbi:hypothetical protein P344_05190 [Spiroplasma mirum ATCC 29335]|uniref:Uncharacterized protein n=1 Tax=Spiroplasma mirum ATCC 29335 TaxID=838561 RepID=W6ANR4_9MOLU|nr:hypothetical protein P344_05190 [Spiroplasma mirum ATCC 29335]AKM53324.1 hypothetical protein SATRI_v1c09350 [Spiroplasma atrichopogonis]